MGAKEEEPGRRCRISVMVIPDRKREEPKVIEHSEPAAIESPAQAPHDDGDPLADRPGDRPDILELKARARELRDNGPVQARGKHGERTLVSVPVGRPEDDVEIQDGPPRPPRQAPRPLDPAALPGLDPSGKPAVAAGFKVV
jgi:hypothetical protein